MAPSTGMKISAEMNDADITTMTMVGRSVMNLPMMPGQNSRDKRRQRGRGRPITGTNILCIAWMKASSGNALLKLALGIFHDHH